MRIIQNTLLASLLFMHTYVFAQTETAELIKSGTQNAGILAEAYTKPLTKAFGADINTGWITTGKVFKPGRFEVRLFANAAFVPQKEQTFDVTAIGLNSNVRLAAGSDKIAATFFGPDKPGPLMKVYSTRPDTKQEEEVTSFNMPEGIGTSIAPIPMAQVNVGLLKETEVMVRFIPERNIGNFNVNMWGVGLKHSLRQWIPVISEMPFDITAAAAYSSFKSHYNLNVKPQSGVFNPNPADYTTQRIVFNTKAFTAMLVASKTISVITGYAGFTYSTAETNTGMLGNYPVTVLREQAPYTKEIRNITDPVNLLANYNQVGLTGGFRLKLSVFTLNAEGTLAKYPTVSAGIGLGFN